MARHPALKKHFLLNPKFWPTWVGIGLLWLTTRLPYPAILFIGKLMGGLTYYLLPERRRITRTNIRLCFPGLSKAEQTRLIKNTFYNSGRAVFESALSWWGSQRKVEPLLHVEGIEHLKMAETQGKGAIMLGGHYTTLEMGGRIFGREIDNLVPTYKRARNPLFEAFMTKARNRRYHEMVRSLNMRDIIRRLKDKKVVWYAPDQDFGLKSSVFAPFMGVQTATLTLTSRLARISGAPVLPWYSERLPGNRGYLMRIGAPLPDFPSGDLVADATAVNQAIEDQVRRTPDQYLWGHRRFKTRPPGEAQVYPPRRDRNLRRYSRLLALLSLPAFIYTVWEAWRNRDRDYLWQRLGRFPATSAPCDIWFHAASVGEVNALMPLLKRLRERWPDKTMVLTTFTPTGGKVAREKLPNGVRHYYLPVDWVFAVRRFLEYSKPDWAIIMETELWPNLHECCYQYGVRVVIINGRMSEKTMNTKDWIRWLISRCVRHTQAILARSEVDKRRFIEREASEERVRVVGNLKYATAPGQQAAPITLARPYILAASTHEDEEYLLARLWAELKIDDHLLVIAPRHPKRLANILKRLEALNLSIAVRSRGEVPDRETQVYIADTFGELGGFIRGAKFTFMGGSLVKVGGHNILEVAQAGKAVIFGPHMHNFHQEAQWFLEHDAARQVGDSDELGAVIRQWLDDPGMPAQRAHNAQALVQRQQHVLDDYVEALTTLIAEQH